MSHNIRVQVYPEGVNKSSVQAEWDSYAAHEDWQEGCSGLNQDIRWINHVCSNEEDARLYIEEHDSGWYDQLAVKFKRVKDLKLSKTYKMLKERYDRLNARYIELNNNIHYKGAKSQLITCRNCGSKIATAYIGEKVNNVCPVCFNDMRPQSTLDMIQRAKQNAKKAFHDLEKEKQKMEAKQVAEICWLVKIEYHT